MDDLYRENILDHFRNPRNFGKLKNPDVTHEEVNLVCGDKIGMNLKINSKYKKIEAITFFGEGCAISMASASLLTEFVKGKTMNEIKEINPNAVKKLIGIDPTPARLKCALLPLETLHKALGELQK